MTGEAEVFKVRGGRTILPESEGFMFKVEMFDKRTDETGKAEIVGIATLEEANRRAELEAYYCCETLLGEWQLAAEALVGGKYCARLAPSTGEAGSITIYVREVLS